MSNRGKIFMTLQVSANGIEEWRKFGPEPGHETSGQ